MAQQASEEKQRVRVELEAQKARATEESARLVEEVNEHRVELQKLKDQSQALEKVREAAYVKSCEEEQRVARITEERARVDAEVKTQEEELEKRRAELLALEDARVAAAKMQADEE